MRVHLSKLNNEDRLSLSGANVFVEKAQTASVFLLDSLSIRLVSFYNRIFNHTKETNLNLASKEIVILEQMYKLLSQCMTSTSPVVDIASSSHLDYSNERIEAHFSCYGFVITMEMGETPRWQYSRA